MSIDVLQQFLPENAHFFIKKWCGDFYIHIKITRDRESKLGDYRKLPDHTHRITINATSQPELFFFVLTHELAHLICFETFGFRVAPHGTEWKQTFRKMLQESMGVYSGDLQPIILKFLKSPKANFMSSTDLVKYFQLNKPNEFFIETLQLGHHFRYKKAQYHIIEKRKKNYLCKNVSTGKTYIFKPVVAVEKI